MHKHLVCASKNIDTARIEAFVERWYPRLVELVDRALAKYAIDKTGSTDALDGFTRYMNGRDRGLPPR